MLLALTYGDEKCENEGVKKMLRVIIAGSRMFSDYEKMKRLVVSFVDGNDIEVVSGGCRGADKFGELLAKEMNWSVKRFPADWKAYGKAAGCIRNKHMAEYADICLLFPVEGAENKGTKNMMREAVKAKCKTYVAR